MLAGWCLNTIVFLPNRDTSCFVILHAKRYRDVTDGPVVFAIFRELICKKSSGFSARVNYFQLMKRWNEFKKLHKY